MKLFVWDFHGTLERGNELAVLETSNTILERHGYEERFTETQCMALYGRKWHEYFSKLLPDEPAEKHLLLQEDCFQFSVEHPEIIAKYIKPTEHAIEVLRRIREKHDQILISNTKPASLTIFMESIGVTPFFPKGKAFATDAHSQDNTKQEILKRYLENNAREEVVAIGDSSSDVDLGHRFGATTVLYTHPGRTPKPCSPHYHINSLEGLLRMI